MNPNKFTLKSRYSSFKFAIRGLWLLLKNEHNSRIHLLAAIVAISTGFFLKINPSEWVLIIIMIGIVFLAELLNSSIETLSDIIDSGFNEQIRKAKDYAAAAVLISAIISLVAGGLIFIPKILALL
jgi:diacylglycerol kinase